MISGVPTGCGISGNTAWGTHLLIADIEQGVLLYLGQRPVRSVKLRVKKNRTGTEPRYKIDRSGIRIRIRRAAEGESNEMYSHGGGGRSRAPRWAMDSECR